MKPTSRLFHSDRWRLRSLQSNPNLDLVLRRESDSDTCHRVRWVLHPSVHLHVPLDLTHATLITHFHALSLTMISCTYEYVIHIPLYCAKSCNQCAI